MATAKASAGKKVIRRRRERKNIERGQAAHYENSILITDGEPEILTAPAI